MLGWPSGYGRIRDPFGLDLTGVEQITRVLASGIESLAAVDPHGLSGHIGRIQLFSDFNEFR